MPHGIFVVKVIIAIGYEEEILSLEQILDLMKVLEILAVPIQVGPQADPSSKV